MKTQPSTDRVVPAPGLTQVREPASPMARKAVLSGTVSSALEWFDFTVYGTLSATVFPALFFSEMSAASGILASFATFGVGFFARPLGGLAFGALGDRLGRRTTLMITLLLMGIASALVGCLPGYAVLGSTAPLLLVLLRFLQGFGLGGEATGAQLMTMEHAPGDRRGYYGALIAMGSPISQVLATLILTGLSGSLSEDAFDSWGWRIPFLVSFLLIGMGVYIRRRLEETPSFQAHLNEQAAQTGQTAAGAQGEPGARGSSSEAPKPRAGALAVFRAHPGTVIRLILSWAAPATLFYITVVYSVSYMTGKLGYTNNDTFTLLLAGNAVSVFAGVVGGRISDRIGRRNTMLIGLAALTLFLIPLFPVLQSRNLPLIVIVIAGGLSSVQFMAGVQPAFFAEAFPTALRYAGSAAGYTGSNLFFSATAPFIASWLMDLSDGNTAFITGYGLLIAAASCVALLRSPKNGPHMI